MRRFAIFLSSEKYDNYSDTDYCHADSDSLKNILIERCDYPKENVLQIKLTPELNKEAAEILKEIDLLLERSEPGDSILFFYAGHGQAINGESYLILPGTREFDTATSSLALRDVHYYLSKNQRLNIRIFDCCHSGENVRNATVSLNSNEFVASVLKEGGDGIITFSSCAINENSYPDNDSRQGVFTSALVQAIANIGDDTPVFIESIKLDVCSRVQKWSEERDKKQTPTLTLHVNGNMPIAFTKKAKLPQVAFTPVPDVPFEERLRKLREGEVVNEEFYPALTELADVIAQEIEKLGKDFNYYGLKIAAKSPSHCESIPSKLEERIVLTMKDRNTMHEMEVVRKKRPDIGGNYFVSSVFKPPPEYDVFYNLSQSSKMPACYIEGELEKDKIAPVSHVFFYICPLQATVAIIAGYYFDMGYNSEPHLRIFMQPPRICSLKIIRDKECLGIVSSVIESFKRDLHAEVLDRVKILEQEIESAG
nr:caspase family protein [uncultured Janthinobacterium sp.]